MSNETLTNLIVDCETKQETIVPLTPEEIADREAMRLAIETVRAAAEAEAARVDALKVSARAKLVAGQPLTADEAALLVL